MSGAPRPQDPKTSGPHALEHCGKREALGDERADETCPGAIVERLQRLPAEAAGQVSIEQRLFVHLVERLRDRLADGGCVEAQCLQALTHTGRAATSNRSFEVGRGAGYAAVVEGSIAAQANQGCVNRVGVAAAAEQTCAQLRLRQLALPEQDQGSGVRVRRVATCRTA